MKKLGSKTIEKTYKNIDRLNHYKIKEHASVYYEIILKLQSIKEKSDVKTPLFFLVGMTGFEPATTRPPAVYANRTAPHPEN